MDVSERRALALDLSIEQSEDGGDRRLTILDSVLLFGFRAAIMAHWSQKWRRQRRVLREPAPQVALYASVS